MSTPKQPGVDVHLTIPRDSGTDTPVYSTRARGGATFVHERVRAGGWAPIVRFMSDDSGNLRMSTGGCVLRDETGEIGDAMLEDEARFLASTEAKIAVLSEAGRQAGTAPRTLLRGRVREALPEFTVANFQRKKSVRLAFTDAIAKVLDQDVQKAKFLRSDFPDIHRDLEGTYLPLIGGEHSDYGSIAYDGTSAEKGMIPAIYVGKRRTDGASGLPAYLTPPVVTPTVNGTPGTTTWVYGVTKITQNGETTLSNVVTVTTGPATLNGTDSIDLDWTDDTDATGYIVYGRRNASPARRLKVLAAGVNTYTDTGVDVEAVPGPPIENTAQIERDGGLFWDFYVVSLGVVEITGLFGSDLAVGAPPKRTALSVLGDVQSAFNGTKAYAFFGAFGSGGFSDGDEVDINGTTYTLQDTLVNSAGNVHIGGTDLETYANLIAAINAGSGAGTAYGTGTTAHADVDAQGPWPVGQAGKPSVDSFTVRAKTIGDAGNAITVTTTCAEQMFFGEGNIPCSTLHLGDDASEGVAGLDFLLPGHEGWPHANPYITLPSGLQITGFYGRGPRSQHHIDGVVTLAVNVCGYEDVGDGSGDSIQEAFPLLQHFLNEFVFKDSGAGYTSGTWGPLEEFADGTPILQTSKFAACQTLTQTWLGDATGYKAAIYLRAPITVRAFLQLWNLTFDCFIAINHHGQVYPILYDPDAGLDEGRLYREITEVLRIESPVLDREHVEPRQLFQFDWDPDTNTFRSEIREVIDQDAFDQQQGSLRATEVRGLRFTRDESTAVDSRERRRNRLRYPRWKQVVVTRYTPGLVDEPGNQVRLTHTGGPGSTGWSVRPFVIEGHRVDPNAGEVTWIGYDVLRMLEEHAEPSDGFPFTFPFSLSA